MNKIINLKIVSILFFCFPLLLAAQNLPDEAPEPATFGIGVVPQYAISNGMRIDLDFRLNDKNQWLVVAPIVFISNESNLDWDYNSMVGAGIEIQHKVFLNRQFKSVNPYFSYGPVFNYFSVKDDGLTAREFAENGGNYIGLAEDEITTRIFKMGGNLIFGLHYFVMDNLYVDAFVGTGIRFSFDDQTTGLHGYYNEWWGDMGYSGTLMVGGFRFGVMF
jgi:hypothetical protein